MKVQGQGKVGNVRRVKGILCSFIYIIVIFHYVLRDVNCLSYDKTNLGVMDSKPLVTNADGSSNPLPPRLSLDGLPADAHDFRKTNRTGRQLTYMSKTLRTMGCLPKFFCSMNAVDQTWNDLAYLIKFAMLDEKEEKEGDKSEKLINVSRSSWSDFHHKSAVISTTTVVPRTTEFPIHELIPIIEEAIKGSDPQQSTKNDQMVDEFIDKLDKEIDKEYRVSDIVEDLQHLIRDGRKLGGKVVKVAKSAVMRNLRRGKSFTEFWKSESFQEQMAMASRVSQIAHRNDIELENACSSAFIKCPYTVAEMRTMTLGPHKTVPIDNSVSMEQEQESREEPYFSPLPIRQYETEMKVHQERTPRPQPPPLSSYVRSNPLNSYFAERKLEVDDESPEEQPEDDEDEDEEDENESERDDQDQREDVRGDNVQRRFQQQPIISSTITTTIKPKITTTTTTKATTTTTVTHKPITTALPQQRKKKAKENYDDELEETKIDHKTLKIIIPLQRVKDKNPVRKVEFGGFGDHDDEKEDPGLEFNWKDESDEEFGTTGDEKSSEEQGTFGEDGMGSKEQPEINLDSQKQKPSPEYPPVTSAEDVNDEFQKIQKQWGDQEEEDIDNSNSEENDSRNKWTSTPSTTPRTTKVTTSKFQRVDTKLKQHNEPSSLKKWEMNRRPSPNWIRPILSENEEPRITTLFQTTQRSTLFQNAAYKPSKTIQQQKQKYSSPFHLTIRNALGTSPHSSDSNWGEEKQSDFSTSLQSALPTRASEGIPKIKQKGKLTKPHFMVNGKEDELDENESDWDKKESEEEIHVVPNKDKKRKTKAKSKPASQSSEEQSKEVQLVVVPVPGADPWNRIPPPPSMANQGYQAPTQLPLSSYDLPYQQPMGYAHNSQVEQPYGSMPFYPTTQPPPQFSYTNYHSSRHPEYQTNNGYHSPQNYQSATYPLRNTDPIYRHTNSPYPNLSPSHDGYMSSQQQYLGHEYTQMQTAPQNGYYDQGYAPPSHPVENQFPMNDAASPYPSYQQQIVPNYSNHLREGHYYDGVQNPPYSSVDYYGNFISKTGMSSRQTRYQKNSKGKQKELLDNENPTRNKKSKQHQHQRNYGESHSRKTTAEGRQRSSSKGLSSLMNTRQKGESSSGSHSKNPKHSSTTSQDPDKRPLLMQQQQTLQLFLAQQLHQLAEQQLQIAKQMPLLESTTTKKPKRITHLHALS